MMSSQAFMQRVTITSVVHGTANGNTPVDSNASALRFKIGRVFGTAVVLVARNPIKQGANT